jgi:hypothetical protein
VLANIAVLTAAVAAIGGLLGSLGSFIGMIFVIKRSSPKERQDAAAGGAGAVEKVLMPQHALVDIANTVVDLKPEERGDDDGPRKRRNRRKRSS